ELRRGEYRVPVDTTHAWTALELPLDGEGAADAAVDQVAVGEAKVGLEAVDARLAEAVPHPRHVAGQGDLDAHDGLATERPEPARDHPRPGSEAPHRGVVGRAHEEVGNQPVVDN